MLLQRRETLTSTVIRLGCSDIITNLALIISRFPVYSVGVVLLQHVIRPVYKELHTDHETGAADNK